MKRLRPSLFHTLPVLSLLLGLAATYMWIRSYSLSDRRQFYVKTQSIWVRSLQGTLRLQWDSGKPRDPWEPIGWITEPTAQSLPPYAGVGDSWQCLGFYAGYGSDVITYSGYPAYSYFIASRYVAFPYWSVVAATLILPLRWFFIQRRYIKRLQTNRCLWCGYDLRASPDRCPECGAIQN